MIDRITSAITSTSNSTTLPLASSATFTGTGEANFLPDVFVVCQTDQDSTLFFDFSIDGVNWSTFPLITITGYYWTTQGVRIEFLKEFFDTQVTNIFDIGASKIDGYFTNIEQFEIVVETTRDDTFVTGRAYFANIRK